MAFDAGVASPAAARASHLFISHAHIDHCGALASILGRRALAGTKTALQVFCPASAAEPLERSVQGFRDASSSRLLCSITPVAPGDVVRPAGTIAVHVHEASHRIPACCFSVDHTTHRLRDDLRGRHHSDIAALKHAGEAVTVPSTATVFAFSGDTSADALRGSAARVLSAALVACECTYVGRDSVRASSRGHVGSGDVAALLSDRLLHDQTLLLMHFSSKYSAQHALDAVRRELGELAAENRVRVLVSPPGR